MHSDQKLIYEYRAENMHKRILIASSFGRKDLMVVPLGQFSLVLSLAMEVETRLEHAINLTLKQKIAI